MTKQNWQLQTPVSAIVFDCDGTLSSIEGVDELARVNGVGEKVSAMTAKAMSFSGINPILYQERLQLINPNRAQVLSLGNEYYRHVVTHAEEVVRILHALNKTIYVISAGLYPAVAFFAEKLSILKQNIFAVDIEFDSDGHYLDFNHHSPLIHHDGKRKIVAELLAKHETIIHIGDGLNDIVVQDLVTRFIGFGGIYFRENIANQCEYYIKTPSLASLLPLILTREEVSTLAGGEQALFAEGLRAFLQKTPT